MADPPDLLKNVRNCLLSQCILVPHSTVKEEYLPSDIVSFEHVKSLIKMQENTELKLAPSLKSEHVNPGQYEKMRVNLAAQVVSHTTSSAQKFCWGADFTTYRLNHSMVSEDD